jgi:hypothetical protein
MRGSFFYCALCTSPSPALTSFGAPSPAGGRRKIAPRGRSSLRGQRSGAKQSSLMSKLDSRLRGNERRIQIPLVPAKGDPGLLTLDCFVASAPRNDEHASWLCTTRAPRRAARTFPFSSLPDFPHFHGEDDEKCSLTRLLLPVVCEYLFSLTRPFRKIGSYLCGTCVKPYGNSPCFTPLSSMS